MGAKKYAKIRRKKHKTKGEILKKKKKKLGPKNFQEKKFLS